MADSKEQREYFSIQAYVAGLVAGGRQVHFHKFMKVVAELGGQLDISFAVKLQEMVRRNECCIPGEFLVDYGVLAGGNLGADIGRLLRRNDFVEGSDYLLCRAAEQHASGGGSNKKGYLLHPRTFKFCLMRAAKDKKYARYYILLEEAIFHYKDYQLGLEQKALAVAEARGAEAAKENSELKAMLARFENRAEARAEEAKQWAEASKQQIGEVKSELGGVKTELGGVKTELRSVKTELGEANGKLDAVVGLGEATLGKLDEVAVCLTGAARGRASVPENPAKTGNLVLFTDPGATPAVKGAEIFGYRFAAVNNRSFRSQLAKIYNTPPFPVSEHVLLALRAVPNALTLYQCLVERLVDGIESQAKRKGKGGSDKCFRLLPGFTEADLIAEIHAEHEARKAGYQEAAVDAQVWGVRTRTTVATTVATTVVVRLGPLGDAELMELLADAGF
jgi:hypothetical protein